MTDIQNLTYGIVGLGIMGGAIAKSIRRNVIELKTNDAAGSGKILVCDKNTESLDAAQKDGIADSAYAADAVKPMLAQCDVVFICLYPRATLTFLAENKASFKSGAIITDISGVKNIFEDAEAHFIRNDVDFILGHPMAGGEKEGYVNSSADFFTGRNYILIPHAQNKAENLAIMRALITRMGFCRITETTADIHDKKIAFTSQLCHIIASALVASAEDEQITAFGGGSFEDLTRIAMINAPLWTELFLLNKKLLLPQIDSFKAKLDELCTAVEQDDAQKLTGLLKEVRNRRMQMDNRP